MKTKLRIFTLFLSLGLLATPLLASEVTPRFVFYSSVVYDPNNSIENWDGVYTVKYPITTATPVTKTGELTYPTFNLVEDHVMCDSYTLTTEPVCQDVPYATLEQSGSQIIQVPYHYQAYVISGEECVDGMILGVAFACPDGGPYDNCCKKSGGSGNWTCYNFNPLPTSDPEQTCYYTYALADFDVLIDQEIPQYVEVQKSTQVCINSTTASVSAYPINTLKAVPKTGTATYEYSTFEVTEEEKLVDVYVDVPEVIDPPATVTDTFVGTPSLEAKAWFFTRPRGGNYVTDIRVVRITGGITAPRKREVLEAWGGVNNVSQNYVGSERVELSTLVPTDQAAQIRIVFKATAPNGDYRRRKIFINVWDRENPEANAPLAADLASSEDEE